MERLSTGDDPLSGSTEAAAAGKASSSSRTGGGGGAGLSPSESGSVRLARGVHAEGRRGEERTRRTANILPRQRYEQRREAGEATYLSGESRLMLLPGAAWLSPDGSSSASGSVEMTNYRLRFAVDATTRLGSGFACVPASYFEVALGCVSNVWREGARRLLVHCKDARKVAIVVESTTTANDAFKLVRACALGEARNHFAATAALTVLPARAPTESDWAAYEPRASYGRWLEKWLEKHGATGRPPPWRLSDANRAYEVCGSYPRVLVVPTTVGDGVVAAASAFRAEGRVPTLSFASVKDAASIWRSSQPKVGVQGNTNASDEALVRAIATADRVVFQGAAGFDTPLGGSFSSSSPATSNGRSESRCDAAETAAVEIVDCRPKTSASANRLGGQGGYESKDRYKDATITFANVPNIHSVRDARDKVVALAAAVPRLHSSSSSKASGVDGQRSHGSQLDGSGHGVSALIRDAAFSGPAPENAENAENPDDDDLRQSVASVDLCWHAAVEDTKWLACIRRLLAAAWDVAYRVHRHRARVLVHCSHGWDRTSQVVALAKLLLLGEARTMRGFARLVEREFVAFGHPFLLRAGHGAAQDQASPIFLQFLDCVWQLAERFPTHFEFDSRFLVVLADHVYASRFPTLAFDTVRDRDAALERAGFPRDAATQRRPPSVWDFLLANAPKLRNPLYDPDSASDVVLPPLSALLRGVQLWTDYHMRYAASPSFVGGTDLLRKWVVREQALDDDDTSADKADVADPPSRNQDPDLFLDLVPHANAPWVASLAHAQRETLAWRRRARVSAGRADRSKIFNMLVEPDRDDSDDADVVARPTPPSPSPSSADLTSTAAPRPPDPPGESEKKLLKP